MASARFVSTINKGASSMTSMSGISAVPSAPRSSLETRVADAGLGDSAARHADAADSFGEIVLRGYMLLAVALVVFRVAQLALQHKGI